MNSKLRVIELDYYDRRCACCGADEHEFLWELEHFARTRSGLHHFRMANGICRHCGFVYVRHTPTPISLEKYYKDTYGAGEYSRSESNTDRRAALVLENSVAGSLVVDIGAGREDDFHKQLSAAGRRVLRMDVKDQESPDSTRFDFVAPGTVDVVTHNFVLEHIPDVVGFLKTCHGMLARQGVMIVDVPDIRSYPTDWMGILPHEHVNHFSPRTLSGILASCGFDVLEASQNISCRAPVGFAVLCRKSDTAHRDGVVATEYVENKRCFQSGVSHVLKHESDLRALAARTQADLDAGRCVVVWCANDRLHRLFQLCGPFRGNVVVVDSDPGKRDYFADVEVFSPERAVSAIRGAEKLVIMSDLNAEGIREYLGNEFGKTFDEKDVETLGIYRLC